MGSSKSPGECPMCGEEADFSVTQDATVTSKFEVPERASGLVGHYDPHAEYYASHRPNTYYYHWVEEDVHEKKKSGSVPQDHHQYIMEQLIFAKSAFERDDDRKAYHHMENAREEAILWDREVANVDVSSMFDDDRLEEIKDIIREECDGRDRAQRLVAGYVDCRE